MRCQIAKEILTNKAVAGKKLPNLILSEMFLEAMLWVANKCVPSELIRKNETEDEIYRVIGDAYFITVPDKPNFDDENDCLMIDESLTYAVINYVAFLINQDIYYRTLALEIIGDYVANFAKEKEYEE